MPLFVSPIRSPSTALLRALLLLLTWAVIGDPQMVHAQCPPLTPQLVEQGVSSGENAGIAMDACGRFVVAWEQDEQINQYVVQDILVKQFDVDGSPVSTQQLITTDGSESFKPLAYNRPSIAASSSGLFTVSMLAQCVGCHCYFEGEPINCGPLVAVNAFAFGSTPSPTGVPVGLAPVGVLHFDPSAASTPFGSAFAWMAVDQGMTNPQGLLEGLSPGDPVVVRACGSVQGDEVCYTDKWSPSTSSRQSDGVYGVVWAEPENFSLETPFLNIALRIYGANGTLLAERAGPAAGGWVNDPTIDGAFATQSRPSVALDDKGNIVVTWVGVQLAGCDGGALRVFARRFKFDVNPYSLRDPNPMNGEGRAGMFIVSLDRPAEPILSTEANPVVALKTGGDEDLGRFVIAWSQQSALSLQIGPREIRGQYFDDKGWPLLGGPVRLNISDGANGVARLSPASQHTLAYGPQQQVAVVWAEGEPVSGIVVTLRPAPASFIPGCAYCQQNPELCFPCLRGDMNGDCLFNGLDIQGFTMAVVNAPCLSVAELCPADMNSDFSVDLADIPCFVQQVLAGDYVPCGGNRGSVGDCNSNGIPDANDIADGTSQDCNQNFIPDECDLDETDPDGNEAVSADMNGNGVPDECEPDCNGNQVPDAWDIGQQTSADVNANAVPDECEADCDQNDLPDSYEIAQQSVPDCNANGIPDGCEADCNANGVPDDCDIDPNDPDGNQQVSPDCNANGLPDSCDLSLPPPFGSVDCNSNGIPDECDIASSECLDENANGICDECEEGSMGDRAAQAGAGESGIGIDTAEAWEAYYEWSMAQTWGEASGLSGEEQFQILMAKLHELGLDPGEVIAPHPSE